MPIAYRITGKNGNDFGVYVGATPAEALAAMHRDAGYDCWSEGDEIRFADHEDAQLCGGLDDYLFTEWK